jgi:hypothetical protein
MAPLSTSLAATCANRRFIRSIAQNKFTAVDALTPGFRYLRKVLAKFGAVLRFESRTPRATPIAAATPMAGAPRTTITPGIASATS